MSLRTSQEEAVPVPREIISSSAPDPSKISRIMYLGYEEDMARASSK